jgi:predicted Rdx family selenoprotein
VSLAEELLVRWAPIIRSLELRTGAHGIFDVELDGEAVFSKSTVGRHPKRGEVASLVESKLGPPLRWREDH